MIVVIIFCHHDITGQQPVYNPVVSFAEDWVRFLKETPIFNPDLDKFYGDTTIWYGSKVPFGELYPLLTQEQNLQEERISGSIILDTLEENGVVDRYLLFFDADPSMHLCSFYGHYIVVEGNPDSGYSISAQSSIIYDSWVKRKAEISSNCLVDDKKYYAIQSDSILFPGYVVYVATDSLHFNEPKRIDPCNGIENSGFSTLGNVYVLIWSIQKEKIIRRTEISRWIYSPVINDNELLVGGFPCFVPSEESIFMYGSSLNIWKAPTVAWYVDSNGSGRMIFSTIYMRGDRCVPCDINLVINRRNKRISASSRLRERTGHIPK